MFGDRLTVPHQTVRELHRNRLSAIGNPEGAALEVRNALAKNRKSTSDALSRWAKQVATVLGCLGWYSVVTGLFLAFLGSALWGLTMLIIVRAATTTNRLPLGPGLVGGALTAIALAA